MNRPLLFLSLLVTALLVSPSAKASPDTAAQPDVRQLLQKLVGYPSDPCGPEPLTEKGWDTSQIETPLFGQVSKLVVDALNTGTATPKERATEALGI